MLPFERPVNLWISKQDFHLCLKVNKTAEMPRELRRKDAEASEKYITAEVFNQSAVSSESDTKRHAVLGTSPGGGSPCKVALYQSLWNKLEKNSVLFNGTVCVCGYISPTYMHTQRTSNKLYLINYWVYLCA